MSAGRLFIDRGPMIKFIPAVCDYLDTRTEKMRASSYLVLGAVVLALAVTTLAVEVE